MGAAEGEHAMRRASCRSFSEALRIIRLALALLLSVVAMNAPTGSMNTVLVAMAAVVIGHALAAVPVHSMEASLLGFAAAIEEVGADQIKATNKFQEPLAFVSVTSNWH